MKSGDFEANLVHKEEMSTRIPASSSSSSNSSGAPPIIPSEGPPTAPGGVCNCNLCHARVLVSIKKTLDEECLFLTNMQPSQLSDGFHVPLPPFLLPTFHNPMGMSGLMTEENVPPAHPNSHIPVVHPSLLMAEGPPTSTVERIMVPLGTPNSGGVDPGGAPGSMLLFPAYISVEGIAHINITSYVVLELTATAFRLVNYRNNSAVSLHISGNFGSIHHYNCRGTINLYNEKVSLEFDTERQVLMRKDKPCLIRKESEFYKMTPQNWSPCRPFCMELFEKDRTCDILRRNTRDRGELLEILKQATLVRKNGRLTILLGRAKVEQTLNGDVHLSWTNSEHQQHLLIVSPTTGTFSVASAQMEIVCTPKLDLYLQFANFYLNVNPRELTVSVGPRSSGNLMPLDTGNVPPQHSCPRAAPSPSQASCTLTLSSSNPPTFPVEGSANTRPVGGTPSSYQTSLFTSSSSVGSCCHPSSQQTQGAHPMHQPVYHGQHSTSNSNCTPQQYAPSPHQQPHSRVNRGGPYSSHNPATYGSTPSSSTTYFAPSYTMEPNCTHLLSGGNYSTYSSRYKRPETSNSTISVYGNE